MSINATTMWNRGIHVLLACAKTQRIELNVIECSGFGIGKAQRNESYERVIDKVKIQVTKVTPI